MKLYYILLLSVFIFIGCTDNNDEVKDVFDLEWNKDMVVEENTMIYTEDGLETVVNIENMKVLLFAIDKRHHMEIKDKDEKLKFTWNNGTLDITTGVVKLYPYGLSKEDDTLTTTYRGMMNIVELTIGEWDRDISDPSTLTAERNISFKAIFHFKKESYYEGDDRKIIGNGEIKGIFYFSGIEINGIYVGQ